MIISRYFSGKISYLQARKQIAEIVDEELGKRRLNPEFTYKDLISLAAEKRNAFTRLERRKNTLERFVKG